MKSARLERLHGLSRVDRVIGPLRGGSRSLLAVDDKSKLWVLKRRINPQHSRLVLNEYLASSIAREINLSVPAHVSMRLDSSLLSLRSRDSVASTSDDLDGLHFASEYAGGMASGIPFDKLPAEHLQSVMNVREFAGVLALDAWLCNADYRQAVFVAFGEHRNLFYAWWIDHGHCFGAETWHLRRWVPRISPAWRNVYLLFRGWNDFEPWLSAIERITAQRLHGFVQELPEEWRVGEEAALSALIASLALRQTRIRDEIDYAIRQRVNLFPNWGRSEERTSAGLTRERQFQRSFTDSITTRGRNQCGALQAARGATRSESEVLVCM